MKKLFSILLLAAMLLTLAACSKQPPDTNAPNQNQNNGGEENNAPENQKVAVRVQSKVEEYNNLGKLGSYHEMTYNENAVMIKRTAVYLDSETGEEQTRSEILYNDHGDRVSSARYIKGVRDESIPAHSFEYTYDAQGNILTASNLSDDGVVMGKAVYTYDARGNRLSETNYDEEGKIRDAYTCTYDENNNLLTHEASSNYGQETWKTTYTYDDHNSKIKSVSVGPFGFASTSISEYTYDESGRKTSQTDYNKDGSKCQFATFTYDENGNEVESTTTYYYEEDTDIERRVTTYNADGLKIKSEEYTNETLTGTTEMTYEDDGNCVTHTITDASGFSRKTKYHFTTLMVSKEVADNQ